MPVADVLVVGAGLAGLTASLAAAERGARVFLAAKGFATTHWSHGGLDVAAPAGARTPRAGVTALAADPGHPYAVVADDLDAGLGRVRVALDAAGLAYDGDLDTPLGRVPTAVGATRPAAILPAAQVAGRAPWQAGERLVVCGIDGYRDLDATAVAASLGRSRPWVGEPAPAEVVGVAADLPGMRERDNLNTLVLGRAFDDPAWRREAVERIAAACRPALLRAAIARVAVPAILGLDDHPAALETIATRLGVPVFEIATVPPSLPGLRLFGALRRAIVAAGGRVQVGFRVTEVLHAADGSVAGLATEGAARPFPIRAAEVILATGGLAGGGIVAGDDGRLRETVLGLRVEAPPPDAWLAPSFLAPGGHPLERAGVRVDAELRPIGGGRRAGHRNVRVAGSLLAGQRYLVDRSGDGVAIASGERAARIATGGGRARRRARSSRPVVAAGVAS